MRHLLEKGGVEEFNVIGLVLDKHTLSCALESQSILCLCKVGGVREKVVGTVKVHQACALNVDAYDCFRLE